MTNEEIYSRIRQHYGLERNIDFARHLGVTPQQANAIVKRVNIDYDLVHEKFPEVSAVWLLSKGERGEMIESDRRNDQTRPSEIYTPQRDDLIDALDCAQRALLNEQETCRKLQNQMDGMLEIMKNMTSKYVVPVTKPQD